MAERSRVWCLIAGGGTAGHVLPGIAVARALVERGHPPETLQFVGSARGVETRLVPGAGFPLTVLPGRGIERRLTVASGRAVGGLIAAIGRAVWLVRRIRPAVVLSLGGYASVPCALAAALWRVPIVVAEQNAAPGAANRLVSRFAQRCAVSFPGTPLPRAVVTGNPVRDEVVAAAADRAGARAALGIADGRRLLLAWGGSLGALRINEAVLEAVARWADRSDLAVRHVVGARDWDLISARSPAPPPGGLDYVAVRYDEDMPRSLAAADLSVSRAGSSACFELAAAGLPAILVPSPHVTADHQNVNARHLAEAGAAVVVSDADLDGARLETEVDRLLADPEELGRMAEAARRFATPEAAARIAGLLEEAATMASGASGATGAPLDARRG